MSQATATHDEHHHPPHLAHHFDTLEQQFESGKLGMWVFLATEILMFGGLFCAYAIYRGNHPDIFMYGHQFLETKWGAINTVVLILSSFSMAWGVRAAQLGQKKLLVWMLALTFGGGCMFMVIKGIEYEAKFSHHLAPGTTNLFYGEIDPEELHHLEEYYGLVGGHGEHAADGAHGDTHTEDHAETSADTHPTAAPTIAPPEQSTIAPPAEAPAGLNPDVIDEAHSSGHAAGHAALTFAELPERAQQRVHLFFQTYFMMTGLHGLHVLIGMALIAWIGIRSLQNQYGPQYFTPVEIVGLYWHLVDLIWIFLFPLLYLIH